MGLLEQLKGRYKVLSIVGMAKNAGKTTALNYILEEAMDEGMLLGVTSTGRDGESSDLVTGTEKPRVFLDAGTLVSVPTQLYEMADAGLEILKMTDYSTAIGDLMICRVADSGYVQIAGPLNIQAHKKLCREMLDMDAEMILIDGAIDRKSIAAPEASDAIILATGAVLSRSLKKVVEETAHTVNLYTLPVEDNPEIRRILEESGEGEKILTISTQETGRKVTLPDIQTGLGASRYLDEAIGAETEYLYIPGALTKNVLADIHPKKLKQVIILTKDPTRIFIDVHSWQQMVKRGLRVKVLANIEVAAVTVNPFSPQGYAFDTEQLTGELRCVLPDIPVVDVKRAF